MPLKKGGSGKGMGCDSVRSTVNALEINLSKHSNSGKPSRSGANDGGSGFKRGPRVGKK